MNRVLCFFAVLLLAVSGGCKVQPAPSGKPSSGLFADKTLVAPGIHVEAASQYAKWEGNVPLGDYLPEAFERRRIGTIAFSPDLRVHVDEVINKVHFPSYYELIDSRNGALLGKYEVFGMEDAEWYFPGNGAAYLNQKHLFLCGPRYTRKIARSGRALAEASQPLVFVGAETEVQEVTPLFDAPSGKRVVATVTPGMKVTVIGLQPGKPDRSDMAMLVKTPYGLTGWHLSRGRPEEGQLNIYQCN